MFRSQSSGTVKSGRKNSPGEQPKAAEEMTSQEEYMGTVRRTSRSRPRRRGMAELDVAMTHF